MTCTCWSLVQDGDACPGRRQDRWRGQGLLADSAAYKTACRERRGADQVWLAGDYSHMLRPGHRQRQELLPRVAALLDVGQISDITAVIAADTFERPIYAGNAIATVQSADATKVDHRAYHRLRRRRPAARWPAPVEAAGAVADLA